MSNSQATIIKDRESEPIKKFLKDQFKPRGKIFTPFNIISVPIIILGYSS